MAAEPTPKNTPARRFVSGLIAVSGAILILQTFIDHRPWRTYILGALVLVAGMQGLLGLLPEVGRTDEPTTWRPSFVLIYLVGLATAAGFIIWGALNGIFGLVVATLLATPAFIISVQVVRLVFRRLKR